MSGISGLGTSSTDFSPQASASSGSSADATPTSWTNDATNTLESGVSDFTDSSNINYLFSKLNQSILSSGNFDGVQTAIDTYAQSLPESAVYDSPYTAPSSQFLKDLAAIKNDASNGNLGAAAADLQTAKYATPDAVTGGGIDVAFDQHNTSAIAAIELEGTVNTAHYLVSQGSTTADANAEAISFTINSVVDKSGNTSTTAKAQDALIADLATSLSKTIDFTQTEAIPTSASSLTNIVESLLGASASTNNGANAYLLNNQVLASLNSIYDSGSSTSAVTIDTSVQIGNAISNHA